jgi:hypothetical protein
MRASRLSRSLATGIDLAAGLALGLLLAPGPLGHYFSERAVVLLRIGQPETWFVGPMAMVIGILGELVFLLPLAVLLVLAPEALVGVSAGKLLFRLRTEAGDRGSRIARLAGRYLVKTLPLSVSVVALVTGVWAIEVVALLLALALTCQWIVACLLSLPLAHDRLAGTVVTRRSLGGGVRGR